MYCYFIKKCYRKKKEKDGTSTAFIVGDRKLSQFCSCKLAVTVVCSFRHICFLLKSLGLDYHKLKLHWVALILSNSCWNQVA